GPDSLVKGVTEADVSLPPAKSDADPSLNRTSGCPWGISVRRLGSRTLVEHSLQPQHDQPQQVDGERSDDRQQEERRVRLPRVGAMGRASTLRVSRSTLTLAMSAPRVARSKLRVEGSTLRVARSKLRVEGSTLSVARSKLRGGR